MCQLVICYWHLGAACCLHLHGSWRCWQKTIYEHGIISKKTVIFVNTTVKIASHTTFVTVKAIIHVRPNKSITCRQFPVYVVLFFHLFLCSSHIPIVNTQQGHKANVRWHHQQLHTLHEIISIFLNIDRHNWSKLVWRYCENLLPRLDGHPQCKLLWVHLQSLRVSPQKNKTFHTFCSATWHTCSMAWLLCSLTCFITIHLKLAL